MWILVRGGAHSVDPHFYAATKTDALDSYAVLHIDEDGAPITEPEIVPRDHAPEVETRLNSLLGEVVVDMRDDERLVPALHVHNASDAADVLHDLRRQKTPPEIDTAVTLAQFVGTHLAAKTRGPSFRLQASRRGMASTVTSEKHRHCTQHRYGARLRGMHVFACDAAPSEANRDEYAFARRCFDALCASLCVGASVDECVDEFTRAMHDGGLQILSRNTVSWTGYEPHEAMHHGVVVRPGDVLQASAFWRNDAHESWCISKCVIPLSPR